MMENKSDRFDTVMYALPLRITQILGKLPLCVRSSVYELRLRKEMPICLTGETTLYVSQDGQASSHLPQNPLTVSSQEINEVIMRITNRSAYTREKELSEGYLAMRYGNRAGVCGNFSQGKLNGITSVNIRIAREIKGCSDPLLPICKNGLLIAGPPGSGKTTILRDLVRQLSYDGKRVCVVDSRMEICAPTDEGATLDVGPNTDVITGSDKAKGVEIALRTMFPHYIAFDEVGNGAELSLIKESFFSGVGIITTAHAASKEDLFSRRVTNMLLTGGIDKVALLGASPMQEITLINTKREELFCLRE